jgi:hypothetical protein
MFELPKKKKWLIVGCGSDASKAYDFISDDVGLITLNRSIATFGKIDAACFTHYETIVLSLDDFKKCKAVYLPDPCLVGTDKANNGRCLEINKENIYSDEISSLPNVLFYERIKNLDDFDKREGLYENLTVATVGLSLLARNNVREVYTVGIGCGHGYNTEICPYPEVMTKMNLAITYGDVSEEFARCCEKWGIEWIKL